METAARRTFTILDGMILVAATALSLVDVGSFGRIAEPTWHSVSRRAGWAGLVYSIALVSLRLRRPRPTRDQLWRQPGWIACSSLTIATAALACYRSLWISQFIAYKMPLVETTRSYFAACLTEYLPIQAAFIVVSAWGALALSGRWESEPSWIDRAGRLIGLGWIIICLVGWVWAWFS